MFKVLFVAENILPYDYNCILLVAGHCLLVDEYFSFHFFLATKNNAVLKTYALMCQQMFSTLG